MVVHHNLQPSEDYILRKLEQLKRHNESLFALMFICFYVSLMLSTSIYGAVHYVIPEVMILYQVLYGCMYIKSIVSMLIILIYLFRNRSHTYEALVKNRLIGQSQVIFSLRGEKVHLHLRGGILR
ncbi:hypothetical protein Ciccas_013567, partial [Cichlidogyrus casuarinus]